MTERQGMWVLRALRHMALGAVLGMGACSAAPPIEGEWSGRDVDGSFVGYAFTADSTVIEVRRDSVREYRYRLHSEYDPPRLELTGAAPERRGVVRFISSDEMRVLLVRAPAPAPQAFAPESPGVVQTRREIR